MICETCGYWAFDYTDAVTDGHHPRCPELVRRDPEVVPALTPEQEAEIEEDVEYIMNKFGVR
jgi:hypothetical protein